MVSAWASENEMVFGQVKTEKKSNEITAIPELLKILELKGCIITIVAHTQDDKTYLVLLYQKSSYKRY